MKHKTIKTIYANALLSDGKILFWWTGQDACSDWTDFYKDFYYANIDVIEYQKHHDLEVVVTRFDYDAENEGYNNLIFDVLAKNFYKQFPISEDLKGEKPY